MARWKQEPIILERKEKAGDRSRTRLSLHRESPAKQFADGMVRIEVNSMAAARVAQRLHGFAIISPTGERKRVPSPAPQPKPAPATVSPSHPPVPEPAPEGAVDRRAAIEAMSKTARMKLARRLEIFGRSTMDDAELITAILAVE